MMSVSSLVTENVATNELKRNFEEGRKRCHFHPRYSTISDMEDLRDGSRNRLWSGNVTPPPLSLSLCPSFRPSLTPLTKYIYIYFLLVFVPFRFTGGRGRDKTIRLSRENSGPPLFSNVFDFDTKSINSLFVSRYRSPREGRKKTILMNFVEDVIVFYL